MKTPFGLMKVPFGHIKSFPERQLRDFTANLSGKLF